MPSAEFFNRYDALRETGISDEQARAFMNLLIFVLADELLMLSKSFKGDIDILKEDIARLEKSLK